MIKCVGFQVQKSLTWGNSWVQISLHSVPMCEMTAPSCTMLALPHPLPSFNLTLDCTPSVPPPQTCVIQFFFLYILSGFCVYWIPLPPLRGQHTALCHPRWLPTSGLTEFAVCWGGVGFEPRTPDLQLGALPFYNFRLTKLTLAHRNYPCLIQVAQVFWRPIFCHKSTLSWP